MGDDGERTAADTDTNPRRSWRRSTFPGADSACDCRGAEGSVRPLCELDNWFDDKWLGLGAQFLFDKASGDFRDLAVPPFTPGRVVAEHQFVQGDNSHYDLAEEARLVHSRERSRKKLDRGIVAFSPSALFYRSAPEGLNAWYSSAVAIGNLPNQRDRWQATGDVDTRSQ